MFNHIIVIEHSFLLIQIQQVFAVFCPKPCADIPDMHADCVVANAQRLRDLLVCLSLYDQL